MIIFKTLTLTFCWVTAGTCSYFSWPVLTTAITTVNCSTTRITSFSTCHETHNNSRPRPKINTQPCINSPCNWKKVWKTFPSNIYMYIYVLWSTRLIAYTCILYIYIIIYIYIYISIYTCTCTYVYAIHMLYMYM